ncbi:MAG: band-7 C-terminal domain-containing protein, partial [Pseudomonadota bacterium]
ILTADGEKQAQILAAEGRREAAYRDAEARERLAEAEARATTMLSTAIGEGNVQAANYFVAQKYVEALAAFATSTNQKTLILPMESSGLLGAIAGIGEIAKEAFGPPDPPSPPPGDARGLAEAPVRPRSPWTPPSSVMPASPEE